MTMAGGSEWSLYTAALMFFPPAAFAVAFVGAAIALLSILIFVGIPLQLLRFFYFWPLVVNSLAAATVVYCVLPLWLNPAAKIDPAGFILRQVPTLVVIVLTVAIYWWFRLPPERKSPPDNDAL